MVDAPASGAGARKGVEVRVLSWAPFICSLAVVTLLKTPEICYILRIVVRQTSPPFASIRSEMGAILGATLFMV